MNSNAFPLSIIVSFVLFVHHVANQIRIRFKSPFESFATESYSTKFRSAKKHNRMISWWRACSFLIPLIGRVLRLLIYFPHSISKCYQKNTCWMLLCSSRTSISSNFREFFTFFCSFFRREFFIDRNWIFLRL